MPEDKIRARYERSLKLALETARIVDRAYFIDNSRAILNPTDMIVPFPVFRMVDGVIAKIYLKEEDFPEWIKPIYQGIFSDSKSPQTALQ